jgi:DNA-binding NarL/FixJ family response regulator
MKLSVLVVSNCPEMADLARRLPQQCPSIRSARICDVHDLPRQVRLLSPKDAVLVDDRLPRSAAALRQVTACVSKLRPRARTLVLGSGDLDDIIRAARAAADGYVRRDASADEIEETIRLACAADEFVLARSITSPPAPSATAGLAGYFGTLALRELTPREREVVLLVATGVTNLEVSAVLGISLETAKWHTKNALHKLGMRNRTELAVRLRRWVVPMDAEPAAC